MKTKKFHYAWIILIACCLLQVAGVGIMSTTSSSFITAVCSDKNLAFVKPYYDKAYDKAYDKYNEYYNNAFNQELNKLKASGIDSNTAQIQAKKTAEETAKAKVETEAIKETVTKATPNFAMYMLLQGIVTGITLFFVNKLLKKFDVRTILLAGTIVTIGTFALMSTFKTLPQWYLAGIVLGISTGIIWFLPTVVMLGNWFFKHLGIAMGVSTASAYIAGMAFNPLISKVFVAHWGWSGAYRAIAAISLVISLCVIFLVRLKPEDKGMIALGADDAEAMKAMAAKYHSPAASAGVEAKRAFRSSAFFLIVIAESLVAYNATHMNVMGNFGNRVGLGANYGFIVSAILLGGIILRFLYGFLNDKIGLKKTIVIGVVVEIVGFLALIYADKTRTIPVAFFGAFLIGSMSGISSTINPILVRQTFGGKNFSAIYGRVVGIVALIGSLAAVVVPTIAKVASYSVTFGLAILFCLVICFCAFTALKKAKKLLAEPEPAQAEPKEEK